jgi:hypothetical protein
MPPVPGARIVSADRFDVQPELHTTVIGEMIRHENDLANLRTMWLPIGQGFIANAYVTADREVHPRI